MMTDTAGKLYLWLPSDAETTAAQAASVTYKTSSAIVTKSDDSATGTLYSPAVPSTITSVTPSGADAARDGKIVIKFSRAMDPSAGTVSLDGGATFLTGGSWSNYNKTYAVPYSGLSGPITFTISIAGFTDCFGTEMAADSSHSFTTVPKCGNGAYLIESDGDSAYTPGYPNDTLHLTVNSGVSGFTYFGVDIAMDDSGHAGGEVCLFVHTRNGAQIGIIATKTDFDTVDSAYAAFNVKAGDVIEVYIVDGLSNAADAAPAVL